MLGEVLDWLGMRWSVQVFLLPWDLPRHFSQERVKNRAVRCSTPGPSDSLDAYSFHEPHLLNSGGSAIRADAHMGVGVLNGARGAVPRASSLWVEQRRSYTLLLLLSLRMPEDVMQTKGVVAT